VIIFMIKRKFTLGDKWKAILQDFVRKTDFSNEKYKIIQNRLKSCVENINDGYGDMLTKCITQSLPEIKISFNDKLLENYTSVLKPNQIVVDSFTIDSLRKK
jgi:hypothetical protein